MKKYLLLFVLVLSLAGCGTSGTPYEQFVADLSDNFNSQQIEGKVNVAIGKKTPISYEAAIDGVNNTVQATFFGHEFFADNDYAYTQLKSKWVKVKLDKPIELAGIADGKPNLPAGDKVLANIDSGSKVVDDALNGKTLNDIVISTGAHKFSITGLEDYMTISTKPGFDLEIKEPSGKFDMTFNFSKGKDVEIPEEASNAIDMTDTLGQAFNSAIAS